MIASKYLVTFVGLLIVSFSLVSSQETSPKKPEPAIEETAAPVMSMTPTAIAESQSNEGKKRSKLEQMRIEHLIAADEWLDEGGLLLRFKLGKETPNTIREATVALTKAKLDLATSNTERETILIEQKKFFEEFKELLDALLEAGARARQEVSQAKLYLIKAEIELEVFRESMKETPSPHK